MDVLHRNRRFGWWSLLLWLSLGLCLEALHGCKVGWYLEVASDARRLLLRLAHAHGTLLALVNIGFAASIRAPERGGKDLARAALCLRWASVLMPLGFLGGGLFVMGADPGLPILAVPVGGIFLLVGVLTTARLVSREPAGLDRGDDATS
jgi:hypothetical protein